MPELSTDPRQGRGLDAQRLAKDSEKSEVFEIDTNKSICYTYNTYKDVVKKIKSTTKKDRLW